MQKLYHLEKFIYIRNILFDIVQFNRWFKKGRGIFVFQLLNWIASWAAGLPESTPTGR